MTDPATQTAAPSPGWKTSEFWIKILAMILSALLSSGVIPGSITAHIVAIISVMAGALGYTVMRTNLKKTTVVNDNVAVANLVRSLIAKSQVVHTETKIPVVAKGTEPPPAAASEK